MGQLLVLLIRKCMLMWLGASTCCMSLLPKWVRLNLDRSYGLDSRSLCALPRVMFVSLCKWSRSGDIQCQQVRRHFEWSAFEPRESDTFGPSILGRIIQDTLSNCFIGSDERIFLIFFPGAACNCFQHIVSAFEPSVYESRISAECQQRVTNVTSRTLRFFSVGSLNYT